jgi:putative oxidoreductase
VIFSNDGDKEIEMNNGITSLAGRILISLIFVASGCMKIMGFGMMTGVLHSKGFPAPPVALALTILIEVGVGLLLLVGFQARTAAWILFLFLIPTTLIFHNFWAAAPGMEQQNQMAHFLKNLAIMGGLLSFAANGAGSLSVDAKRHAA